MAEPLAAGPNVGPGPGLPRRPLLGPARGHRRLRGRGPAPRGQTQVRRLSGSHRLVRPQAPQGPSAHGESQPRQEPQLRWSSVPEVGLAFINRFY
jgi:hypothetical protein